MNGVDKKIEKLSSNREEKKINLENLVKKKTDLENNCKMISNIKKNL